MSALVAISVAASGRLTASLLSPTLLTSSWLHTSCTQLVSRRERYGNEEGHDLKNEVRKEAWINKRRKKYTGQGWRRNEAELPPDPFLSYGLSSKPDWSFQDGRPGYYNKQQLEAFEIMRQMCEDVQSALKYVNKKV
jgi:hypothetical protein